MRGGCLCGLSFFDPFAALKIFLTERTGFYSRIMKGLALEEVPKNRLKTDSIRLFLGFWIPAFAGMTEVQAGMTSKCLFFVLEAKLDRRPIIPLLE
jgi:hypothetical protein